MHNALRLVLIAAILSLVPRAVHACAVRDPAGLSPCAPWRCRVGLDARPPVIPLHSHGEPGVARSQHAPSAGSAQPIVSAAPEPGRTPGPAREAERPWFEYGMTLHLWDTQPMAGKNHTRVRRFENKFTIRPARDVELVTMVDLSRRLNPERDVSHLQDAYARWQFAKGWRWVAGQFKIPFSEEALRSSSTLDTIERAQSNARADRIGNLRQLGTMMEYRNQTLLVQLGAFSGEAANQSIGTDMDQAILRCVWVPAPQWSIGCAVGSGSRQERGRHLRDTRQGIQVAWDNTPWLVEFEWAQGLLETLPVVRGVPTVLAQNRCGWYGKVRYDVSRRLQLVVRVDDFYPNTGLPGGNGQRDVTVGFNYWLRRGPPDVKLQLNYVNRRAFSRVRVPDLLRANLQFAL